MWFPLSWLLICVGLVCLLHQTNGKFDADEVARVLQASLDCRTNPGLAVSVVKDGKVIFSRGFGMANLESKQPVDENTIFGIASVSKSFAAALLVKLLYQTKNLTVDSRIRDLLGDEFQMHDQFRTQEATFADLMGHRMAVPANNRMRFDTNLTRDTLLERFPLLESNLQFRVKYKYSNIMYGFVTYLAQRLGGSTWEDLLTKHILNPLQMKRTVFATTTDFNDNFATGYTEYDGDRHVVNPEFSRKWGDLAGSGAVMSTASDMAKWMNFHLKGGKGPDGVTVMESKQVDELHKARLAISTTYTLELRKPRFPVTNTVNIYAHGLRKGFYRGYETLGHSGTTLGYRAYMMMLPGENIGVFTAMTGDDNKYIYRSALQYYLIDSALDGVSPWLNASTICSYPEPWRKRPSPSSDVKLDPSIPLPLSDKELFVGTYHNKAYGYIKIQFNESLNALTLNYGWGDWRLYYRPLTSSRYGYRFYGKALGITTLHLNPVYFVPDTNKERIVSFLARAFDSDVSPDFIKLENNQQEMTMEPDFKTLENNEQKMTIKLETSTIETSTIKTSTIETSTIKTSTLDTSTLEISTESPRNFTLRMSGDFNIVALIIMAVVAIFI